MLENIWAKPNKPYENIIGETLAEHTDALIHFWKEIKERYQDLIQKDDEFWYDSFVAILFHDLGKVSENFQNLMGWVERQEQPKFDQLVRHEFLSGLFLANLRPILIKKPSSLFAVFSHHKAFTIDFFAGQIGQWSATQENLNAFFDYVRVKLEETYPNDSRNAFIRISESDRVSMFYLNDHFKNMAEMSARATNLIYGKAISNVLASDRKEYIYQKALLVASDWTASQEKERRTLERSLIFNQDYLKNKIVEKLRKSGKNKIADGFTFRDFQLIADTKEVSVIAIAPTGSGKTEAALLWASHKNEFNKILYLLPTRNTSNALYLRLKGYFNESNTAIVHSSAKLFRQNEAEKQKREQKETGEISDGSFDFSNLIYLRDQAFFKPVTISTIDQLLTMGFNAGEWELRTFHLLEGRVIIDEVHAYAPYTLGLLIASIKYLKENFNTKFFVMTATMPKQLEQLFKEALTDSQGNKPEIIRDNQLLQKARNEVWVIDKNIDELKDRLISNLHNGKKILVVVNTVDEAIRLYNDFKESCSEYNPICYHSRFIQKDRIKKEEKILDNEKENISQLLIATQVVEVSLDIDYDILFTENAPIDAIIQRAGRVNRSRDEKKHTEVIVFQHSSITEKVYEEAFNKGVLTDTFDKLFLKNGKRLTEQDWLDLVNEIYKDWNFVEHPSYIEGLKKYETIQRNNLNYIMDFTSTLGEKVLTREGLDTVSFIPLQFLNDCKKLKKEKKSNKIEEYVISVRKKRFNAYLYGWKSYGLSEKPIEEIFENYRFIEIEYNEEVGLVFPEKKSKSEEQSVYFF